ncbi:MAG: YqgE/AlgH family protein, partial [Geminicoccaceae bacterium]
PARQVTALGYAGWGPGQLDNEIQDNAWLLVPADPHLVFEVDNGAKWQEALNKIGVDPNLLSSQAGHA